MNLQERLRTTGQSLWLDHVSREQIHDGSLMRCITDWSITGISICPEAFGNSLSFSGIYDDVILKKLEDGLYGEELVRGLICEDVRYSADLLRHVYDRTDGVDGWVVFPGSPLSIYVTDLLAKAVTELYVHVQRPNILATIAGTSENLSTIEEIIFAGVPLNISFIYSHNQYLSVADAYMRGINRRITAGLKPTVSAFISIPISRLARALNKTVAPKTASITAIAMAKKIFKTMRIQHTSSQWERAYSAGAKPLKIIWSGSAYEQGKDSDSLLQRQLLAPFTVTSLAEVEIKSFFSRTRIEPIMPNDGGDCEKTLQDLKDKGVNLDGLATTLQKEDVTAQLKTWIMLREIVAHKSATVIQTKNILPTGEQR